MNRRDFALGLPLAAMARGALAFDADADVRNLRVLDLVESGRRVVVVAPAYLQPDAELPLVVALHGLGETGDPRLGAHAWLELYGLGRAWQRLTRPPLERTSTRGEWTDARLAEVNAELAARPFRGLVVACPHMPNPRGPGEIDAYAAWLTSALLERVRREVPQTSRRADATYLTGVSLGGWVSLEIVVRHPGVFAAWAGVQTAIGGWAATRFAEKIAMSATRPRALLVLTSTQDHFRASSEALGRELAARGLATTTRVVPGPHDQPWLREAGTLETLHWLDRLDPVAGGGRVREFPSRDTSASHRDRNDRGT